jgi:hypothetical protein
VFFHLSSRHCHFVQLNDCEFLKYCRTITHIRIVSLFLTLLFPKRWISQKYRITQSKLTLSYFILVNDCTFYTRLVTSRLLVKWCSVSKPVLVKPALNPIYTSINTGVNNTGLNKTGVYDALLIFQCYGLGILLSKAVCPSSARALMLCNPMSELGPAT